MAVQLNTSAVTKANSLISSGNTKNSQSWNPPSTNEENSYIEQNGITAFANWFLGEDTSIVPENKTRYKYIYTSDFQNVDRAGLIAIRQRAGQQGETGIFDAAGAMIEKIDKKSTASVETVEAINSQEAAPVETQETVATEVAPTVEVTSTESTETAEAACKTKMKAVCKNKMKGVCKNKSNSQDMCQCEDPTCEVCNGPECMCEDPTCEVCTEARKIKMNAECKTKTNAECKTDMKAGKKMKAKASTVQTKFGPETVISITSEE